MLGDIVRRGGHLVSFFSVTTTRPMSAILRQMTSGKTLNGDILEVEGSLGQTSDNAADNFAFLKFSTAKEDRFDRFVISAID